MMPLRPIPLMMMMPSPRAEAQVVEAPLLQPLVTIHPTYHLPAYLAVSQRSTVMLAPLNESIGRGRGSSNRDYIRSQTSQPPRCSRPVEGLLVRPLGLAVRHGRHLAPPPLAKPHVLPISMAVILAMDRLQSPPLMSHL